MTDAEVTKKGTDPAPEGQVWVCGACGKTSPTMYGCDAEGKFCAFSRGWDESCMLNAVLCWKKKAHGRWYSADGPEPVDPE